jgi:uncharacterized membrane protein
MKIKITTPPSKHVLRALTLLACAVTGLFAFLVLWGGKSVQLFGTRISLSNLSDLLNVSVFMLFASLLLADDGWVRRRSAFIVALMAAGYAGLLSAASLVKHYSFQSTAFDLGVYFQLIKGIFGPEPFYSGLIQSNIDHVMPILYPLGLLQRLFHGPEWLLIMQSCVLALGVIPLYKFALQKTGDERVSLLLAFLYLSQKPVIYQNLFDFHPEVLGTTFILYAFYYLDTGRMAAFAAMSVLALSCKETVTEVYAGMGLYLVVAKRKYLFGAALFAGACALFVLDLTVIIPRFLSGWLPMQDRYTYLGTSLPEIMKNTFLHPGAVLGVILTPEKGYYLASLLWSAGFLSLAGFKYLLPCLPVLLQNLLSNNAAQLLFATQYNAEIAPFIFFSAAAGAGWLLRSAWIRENARISWMLFGKPENVFVFVLAVSIPFTGLWKPFEFLRDGTGGEYVKRTRGMIAMIPKAEPVCTQNNLVPQFLDSKEVYMIAFKPESQGVPKWILFDERLNTMDARMFKIKDLYKNTLERFLNDKRYELVKQVGLSCLFKRKD